MVLSLYPDRHKSALLDDDGIAAVGAKIMHGNIYLNKQTPLNTRDPVNLDVHNRDDFYKSTPQYVITSGSASACLCVPVGSASVCMWGGGGGSYQWKAHLADTCSL